jgi:hypothetical protein
MHVTHARLRRLVRLARSIGSISSWVCLICLLGGCGDGRLPTYPVRGRVVFESGAPVRMGSVEFRSEKHQLAASGLINSNGEFTLGTYAGGDGAVAGDHQIVVSQYVSPTSHPAAEHTHAHGDALHATGLVAIRHSRYESSGLKATVEPNDENFVELVVEKMPAE